MKKIAIAMSGGIDSSVSAFLLKKAGFDVMGVYGIFHKNYNVKSLNTAKKTAKILKIPFFIINLQKEFKKAIIDQFIKDLKSGLTPNPCVACNDLIKFGLLLKSTKKLGAEMFSTGHYAQIKEKNSFQLLKAKDLTKDQSYFLWRLKQDQLKKILFPLAHLKKEEVRILAKENNLPAFHSKESQDICFCPNFKDFLTKYIKPKKGNIVDSNNNIMGKHEGLCLYTIGQRQGIKLAGGPFYVLEKDFKNNLLIVTKNSKDLLQKNLFAKDVNWISGITPKFPLRAKVQIRYRHKAELATIIKENNFLKVEFYKPQKAITPGQSVVLYKSNQVIGGGIIQ